SGNAPSFGEGARRTGRAVMNFVIGTFVFSFGLVFGSFLNVCIHRLPREASIVRPGSHCPNCQKPIAWYDNIPLVSYILLGAKCRYCRSKISIRYFLVELASGAVWILLWRSYGFSPFFAVGVLLFSILLAVSVIDFETGLVPDRLTLPGLAAGFLVSGLFPALQGQGLWFKGFAASGLGILAGGGSLWIIAIAGDFIYRRESMGGGDIKLMAMLGAFLGIKKVLLVLFVGPMVAMPCALYMKFFRKADTIPFGPFLAVAGGWLFIYGDLIAEYLFAF
ncbi:MAG: prepilin peptidase, partial [Candidatus Omnitrophica bacterium]|nr:prepilin peptidase [Candidatus Omnitrophota bacterium]